MNFHIIGTVEHIGEYENIIKDWNWSNIQVGDILYTASHSALLIGDLKVIMKNNNTVTLKYIPEQ